MGTIISILLYLFVGFLISVWMRAMDEKEWDEGGYDKTALIVFIMVLWPPVALIGVIVGLLNRLIILHDKIICRLKVK